VVIMPPLCIDDDEIDLLVAAAEAAIRETTA
jgi:adenosylmethionine-8-amino-7-oxononanoate aminotransferase